MRGWMAAVAAAGWLTGCVSAELNGNTLDLASTVAELQTRQVVQNLGRFIDDPDALPAQAVLIAGTVQVTNNGSASLSLPLDLIGKFSRNLGVSTGFDWIENWNVVPVTDGDDIRRLRALYRFAVYGNHAGDQPSPERPGPYDFDISYVQPELRQAANRRPRAFTGAEPADAPGVLHTGWLYWSDSLLATEADQPEPPRAGARLYLLGHVGTRTLFTANRAAWSDFVIAVQGATTAAHSFGLRPVLGAE
jgi:hypothetical protein